MDIKCHCEIRCSCLERYSKCTSLHRKTECVKKNSALWSIKIPTCIGVVNRTQKIVDLETFDPISKSRNLLLQVTKSHFLCVSFSLGFLIFFHKISESWICFFNRGFPAKVFKCLKLADQKLMTVHDLTRS